MALSLSARCLDASEMAAAVAEAERLLIERRDLINTKNIRCRWQANVLTGADCEFETFDPIIDIATVCWGLVRMHGCWACWRACMAKGVPVQR